VRLLATRYRNLIEAPEYLAELSAANGWCAAFFQPKRPGALDPITQEQFVTWIRDPSKVAKPLRNLADGLAARADFFHWELAFPEVFRPAGEKTGGFDVVLGNPPWERIKLQETEWFAERNPSIAQAPNADVRKKMITRLKTDGDPLYDEYVEALHVSEAMSVFIRQSTKYPLCGRGDVNLFSVFAELARNLLAPEGRLGIIVPSGIATDDTTKDFFADIVQQRQLVSFYEFENWGFFGAGHGHMLRFALTTIAKLSDSTRKADFVFQARSVAELSDSSRHFELSDRDIAVINPNTKTAPIFRNQRDASISINVYKRTSILIREGEQGGNPWGIRFMAMLHMANDSGLFRTRKEMEVDRFVLNGNRYTKGNEVFLPLYEAKMVYQYDHRYGDFSKAKTGERAHVLPSSNPIEYLDPAFEVQPYYWVKGAEVDAVLSKKWTNGWLLGWREVTDSRASARTVIATILPKAAVGNKILLMMPDIIKGASFVILANLDSICLDYFARQKTGGNSLNYFIMRQLPILPPSAYTLLCPWERSVGTVEDWIKPRVLELVYTSDSLEPFARDLGYTGRPFRWNPERRSVLRCELDAAFFHLYGIDREDTDYILETFPIVKRHDEEEFGEYRTKRVILEIYDALAEAIRSNRPYLSRLDPKPGEVASGKAEGISADEFIAMAYPSSEADKAVCAAALAAVEQSNGLSSMDHLDVLLLTTHPDWCEAFLNAAEVRALKSVLRSAPAALSFGQDQSIRWKECRDHLVSRNAITVNNSEKNQTITVGSQFAAVKAKLPRGVDDVVECALKALNTIVETRKTLTSAPQTQRLILDFLEQQHRLNNLAA